MSVYRGELPADHYTMVSNAWLRDPRLSWKAKGLAAYIASHRDGHELTEAQMLAESADGRDSLRAGLRDLERFGYLRRVRQRKGHQLAGMDYRLQDPYDGKPVAVSDLGKRGKPAGQHWDGKPVAVPSYKKTKKTSTRTRLLSHDEWDARPPVDWGSTDERSA